MPGPTCCCAPRSCGGGKHERAIEAVRTEDAAGGGEKLPLGLYRIRGEALANLGRADEAAAAFEREIEVFPDELEAYSHLAVLRALAGDDRDPAALRRMVEANPRRRLRPGGQDTAPAGRSRQRRAAPGLRAHSAGRTTRSSSAAPLRPPKQRRTMRRWLRRVV